MPFKSQFLYMFMGISLCFSGITHAFHAPEELDKTIGDLSLIQQDRNLPFDQSANLIAPQASNWRGVRSGGPDFSFLAAGAPFRLSSISGMPAGPIGDEPAAINVIRSFAEVRRADWPGLEDAGFSPLIAREFGGMWHVTLQQAYQGIPVYGSRLNAKITSDGDLVALSVRLFPPDRLELSFPLSAETALNFLTDDPFAQLDFSKKVLYPFSSGDALELISAWQLRATTDRADFCPTGIVDARTGQVWLKYNDVAFDDVFGNVTGLVLPHYWDDEPQAWPQKHQWVNPVGQGEVYTDTLGDYSMSLPAGLYIIQGQLKGLYVDVNYEDGPDASYQNVAQTGQAHDWLWDYGLARQDEANMYYHTTLVHDYFKALDPDLTALDYPLPATVAFGDNYQNAFWSGSGIFFGEGGYLYRNFALFCDVIYHEYTHGITDMIYPPGLLPYVGQSGAMNEAWSDYFACTITGESQIGEGGLMTNGQVMRDLDNTLRYPDNWVGEVHADGRIIGGAFWDLREAIGADLADSLLHFSKYFLAETWEDYFVDVLVCDDDDGDLSNGGPHHFEIYQAFGLHGIGPGLEPVLAIYPTEVFEDGTGGSVGNGDGFFDPGEVLSMTFSVTDFRYLYPPPAQGVSVSVSSDDDDLSFDPQTFFLGDIPAGLTVQAPESLMITVSPQADLAFTQIIFDISANGGAYQVSDSVEIIVGHPPTLLVDDDGEAEYQTFIASSLRQWGQVFSTYDVAESGEVSLDYMNEFEVLIWLTGDEEINTLTEVDRSNLSDYLDGGSDLFLTGQNLVEDIGGTDFFADYLGAAPLAGDVDDLILDGVPGDLISDGQWIMILGAIAGNNQTSPGAISALPGAQEIFHYRYDPENRPGAVRYDSGTFKTVTFAFGAEAISGLAGSTWREDVLTSILAWFGLPTAVEDELSASPAREFSLGGSYPNPFNAQMTIPLQLPGSSWVRIELYDLQGRSLGTVYDGILGAGLQGIRYDASHLTSGMYFLRIQADVHGGNDVMSAVKKVMLLR